MMETKVSTFCAPCKTGHLTMPAHTDFTVTKVTTLCGSCKTGHLTMPSHADFMVREDIFLGQFQPPTNSRFAHANAFHSRSISKIKKNLFYVKLI